MREIRFRLRIGGRIIGHEKWHKGNGSTAHWKHLKIGETVWYPAFLYATEKDEYIGLHDKNGKEMYEGDIVKEAVKLKDAVYLDGKSVGEVIWHRDGFVVKAENWHQIIPDWVEVIGNIYENPELLKG